MIYREIEPDTPLTDFVKNYWWLDNSAPRKLNFTILPDGYFDLLIHFSNNIQSAICLTGLWTKPVEVMIEPNTQIFAIRFKPLAVDYILQHSIASIYNNERQLQGNFWEIDEMDFIYFDKSVDYFNGILHSILKSQKGIDERKQRLFALLYATDGELKIQEYSEKVFWTSRQMNRYFSAQFGLSLKTYCNILKFFASLKQVIDGNFYPQQNYFDQSHFTKALKKHTGSSPKELFINKNDRFLQLSTQFEK